MPNPNPTPETMLSAVEDCMQQVIQRIYQPAYSGLHDMLTYHMGWQAAPGAAEARGKRVRPLILLTVCQAAGANWEAAIPAAAAVELLHNFSLIHDDIEDNSPLRRGRPTVWTRWGIPQALNAGDAQYTLAHLALLDLNDPNPEVVLQAARLLQETCLALTQGQFMDISFEHRSDVTIEEYLLMIKGKTAALLSACCGLGALIAHASAEQYRQYCLFGENLGLAFQAVDDYLGIWGDAALTGKSTDSDLLTGKKTLPVLHGLAQSEAFAARWHNGDILPADLPALIKMLETAGSNVYTQSLAGQLTDASLQALALAAPQSAARYALENLASSLLKRFS